MTEIGLTAATNLLGLVFAIVFARWLVTIDPGAPELRRLDIAVKHAIDVQLWRSFRGVGGLAVVGLAVALLGPALRALGPGGPGFIGDLLLTLLFSVMGVLIPCATAAVSAQLARAGSIRAVAAARHDRAAALTVLLRSTGTAALFASTSMVLACIVAFILALALAGAFSEPAAMDREVAGATLRVSTLALGAAIAALVLHRAGVVYRAAAALAGGDLEATGGLERHDARNPALIASLVGSHVGRAATRVLDYQLAVAVGAAVFAPLGATLYVATGSAGLALLPTVAYGFAVLAGTIGLAVVRVEAQEGLSRGLLRGLAATTLIATAGLAGAAVWLVGEHWRLLSGAGLLVLVSLLAAGHLVAARLRTRHGIQREIGAAQRTGTTPALLAAAGAALETALPLILGAGLPLVFAWHLGEMTGLPLGGVLGLALSLAVLLSAAPFVVALDVLEPLTEDLPSVHALGPDPSSPETTHRLRELADSSTTPGLVARLYLALLSAMLGFGATWILGVSGAGTNGGLLSFGVGVARPAIVWSGALGAVTVFALVGAATRAVARVATDLTQEVDRQLRRFPRENGLVQLPPGHAPSYRGCIDLATQGSHSGLTWVVAALAAPLLVAFGTSSFGVHDSSVPEQALAALLLATTATGVAIVLAASAAGTLLCHPRGPTRRSAGGDTARSLGETLETTVGPTASLVLKVIAIAALSFVPFLI